MSSKFFVILDNSLRKVNQRKNVSFTSGRDTFRINGLGETPPGILHQNSRHVAQAGEGPLRAAKDIAQQLLRVLLLWHPKVMQKVNTNYMINFVQKPFL